MAGVATVRSNSIVVAKGGRALGIGAGQQNRVDSARIATERAAGRVVGGVAASDAFFPFHDGVDVIAAAGVGAVIQPGGSVRDDEAVAAADEHGIAMVMTGDVISGAERVWQATVAVVRLRGPRRSTRARTG